MTRTDPDHATRAQRALERAFPKWTVWVEEPDTEADDPDRRWRAAPIAGLPRHIARRQTAAVAAGDPADLFTRLLAAPPRPERACSVCRCAHRGDCLSCGCTCPAPQDQPCPCCGAHDATPFAEPAP